MGEKGILNEGLQLLAQPDVDKALDSIAKLKNLIKSEKSSHIQSTSQGRGFSYLELNSIRKSGKNKSEQMETVFKILQKGLSTQFAKRGNVPPETQQTIYAAFEEVGEMAALEGDEYRSTEQSIFFKDGAGTGYAVVIGFDTVENDESKRNWYYTWFSVQFELMPDVMVIRHSKSNFWGSSSKDEIKYVARGINEGDVKELLSLCFSVHLMALGSDIKALPSS